MRVLLVDDHPAIRLGMRALLRVTDDIEVVGEARDTGEAVLLTRELEPDLVVLDLRLPGDADGIQVCREIKSFPEPPSVLIHTAHGTPADSALATLAGADGYLNKGVEHVGLPEVIRRTYAGERVWLSAAEPEETRFHLVEVLTNANLTAKEHEVFDLLVRRYSNVRIAEELYVSLPTVKTHVRSIFRKLGLKDRRDLLQSYASEA